MGVVMEPKAYAIIGPDNKALNFVLWDGVSEYDYGKDQGNYIVPISDGSRYGFGWDWNGTEFVDPSLNVEGAPV